MPDDRSSVAYQLRPEARWHDGQPVTADDVIFSFDILTAKGQPLYRAYYANVVKAERDGERRVKFPFDGTSNRELPLIMGQMPVLPKHYWEGREFDRTTLEPPLGSGPYRIKTSIAGRSIAYERVPDYWGADLAGQSGPQQFRHAALRVLPRPDVALEAFKAGQYDLRVENQLKRFWATGYDGPALAAGADQQARDPDRGRHGMQGFVFNTRRAKFADPRVRQALGYAFDFEWTNKNLFYGQYKRTDSYFANSELAAHGLPGADELALLEPFRDQLPQEVFDAEFKPPVTDGSGNNRDNLREAVALLKEAGWEIQGGKLVNTATGEPLAFEIMIDSGGRSSASSGRSRKPRAPGHRRRPSAPSTMPIPEPPATTSTST